jgi:RNA polymerase sigma factor (sigma-70 family)
MAEFERLYRTFAVVVRRHLVYLTGDRALADDLTQETFGKLYEIERSGGSDVHDARAWLLTVASNLAYNHFRSETRRRTRETACSEGPAQISTVTTVDDVLDVRRVLGQLDPRDRMVLMLRHSGFNYAEIAEAVGMERGSVGTTLARAQRRFRTVYEGAPTGSGDEE